MSLLGAIKSYYESGSSTQLTALRAALGTGKIWADDLPPTLDRPFVILSESTTKGLKEPAAGSSRSRVMDVSVGFVVKAIGRASCEDILECLDNAFIDKQLTITGRSHLGTYFTDRSLFWDGQNWTGELVLTYRVSKTAG